jgi:hypothetical protein
MKTSQSFGVHFTINKEKAKDGITNVYAAVTINKEKAIFALKHYVKVENWDAGHSGLKAKVPEAKETNSYLEKVKFTITTYYQQLQIAGKEVTPTLLKAIEGRQRRISLDGDHFWVDLVFYNRILKCFVLIDLKIGKLTHQDIGQMQMYVNYYDRKVKSGGERPTLGINSAKRTTGQLLSLRYRSTMNRYSAKNTNYICQVKKNCKNK